jgi:hypothetical protein
MSEKGEDNAPLTARFLAQVFTSFETRLETKLDARFTALRSEMIERIENSETKLLKEFRKRAVWIEAAGRVTEARSFGLD